MSHFSSFVLRIISDSGDVIDWSVNSTITFRDVLEAISQIVPQATATAFDYEDEDGDKITVRSDDELKAMINGYFWVHSQRMKQGKNDLEPLSIFPRACKTPRKRNVCGLTINTKAAAVSNSSVSQNAHDNCSSVIKKEPENFRNILARGQISADQIQHLEILGHGNGGTVYRALHETTNKVIAVKVIPLDVTPEIQKQIIQELEILFQCSSPFIIEFYGAFFVESRISICTEFMDGGSLEMYGKIPEPVLGRITAAVVKGLVYLWELKIMHRDVKPSNILVNTRGQVKMCDFGVSRQLVNSIATTYVGTNAYMAPERILGSEYSVRSELWSLGVSLLEMSLGRFPYPTENPGKVDTLLPIELLQCIVHENPPRLPEGRFSLAFADFISQCMRKNPLARPAPEALMGHPFIRSNDDGNIDIISMWVCRQLEDIKSRAQSMDSPISQE